MRVAPRWWSRFCHAAYTSSQGRWGQTRLKNELRKDAASFKSHQLKGQAWSRWLRGPRRERSWWRFRTRRNRRPRFDDLKKVIPLLLAVGYSVEKKKHILKIKEHFLGVKSCIFLPDWRPSPGAKGPSWGFLARHRSMKSNQWLFLKNILEDGKDGSNGNQAINVGTSIQGVERDNILSLPLGFHLNFVLVFLKLIVIIVLLIRDQ